MIVSKELAIKAGAGLATAAAGGTSIYYGVDYHQNKITIYDQALINFLDDGGNIKFKVTQGSAGTDLTTFPTTFENKKLIVTVKISTKDNDAGTLTELNGVDKKRASKAVLKKVNGETNNDWSWNCKIIFNAGDSNQSVFKDAVKNRIFAATNQGFLGILKDNENKQIEKAKFIEKCARHRGWAKNKTINNGEKTNERVIGANEEINIYLKEEESKLIFKNQWELDYWFPEIK